MKMDYWGVKMHGVSENGLSFKPGYEGGIRDILDEKNNGDYDMAVDLPNGKRISLWLEGTEDDSYFGFCAGYPWESGMKEIEQKDVEDAIVQVLLPYLNMTEDELRTKIDDIDTYNCG